MIDLGQVPDDRLIAEVVRRGYANADHIANVEPIGFNLSHPLGCKPQENVCAVQMAIEDGFVNSEPPGISPWESGKYKASIIDGALRMDVIA